MGSNLPQSLVEVKVEVSHSCFLVPDLGEKNAQQADVNSTRSNHRRWVMKCGICSSSDSFRNMQNQKQHLRGVIDKQDTPQVSRGFYIHATTRLVMAKKKKKANTVYSYHISYFV